LLTALFSSLFANLAHADSANMAVTEYTSVPIGYYDFCKVNADDCSQRADDTGPLALDKPTWKTILRVNYTVNTSIQPLTDMQIYGVDERWAYPTTTGDCEDYVLLKRKMLIREGLSPSNLLITVVRQPNGDGHAVLTVRTDRGDFVLDNMRNKVLRWDESEYTFLKRQSSDDPTSWVELDDTHIADVASLR
ncbi:MAG: hypothetical protein RIR97_1728, partial [Pseudomonadota bacterium]